MSPDPVHTAYDVAIVLGNSFRTAQSRESMRLRAKRAAGLWQEGQCKKIILSGGYATNKHLSEARYMYDFAQKAGVPADSLLLEEESTTTAENAAYSGKIMKENGFESAVVITSDYHYPRAKYLFSKILYKHQLEYSICPAHLTCMQSFVIRLREMGAFVIAPVRIQRVQRITAK